MSGSNHLVSFDRLKEILDLRGFENGHESVVVNREGFEWLLRQYVASFPVDPEWYCEANNDVEQAVAADQIKDPAAHFVTQGYVEGRSYCPADFDEATYLKNNLDLQESHADGTLTDLKAHYVQYGFAEGRRYE